MKVFSYVLIGCCFYFSICCVPIKNTNASKNEAATMNIVAEKQAIIFNELPSQEPDKARGLLTAEILGKGVSLAAEGVKKLIEIDKKKYTAEYQMALDHLYFYNNLSTEGAMDPTGMAFGGIEILRMIDTKSGIRDTAVYLSLELDKSNPLETLNNGIFRLKVRDFKLKYSKVKVPSAKWYLPWTLFFKNDKAINMDFEIGLNAHWMSVAGAFNHNIEIGKFILSLRDIPLRQEDQQLFTDELKGRLLDGYAMLVPRSYGFFNNKSGELVKSYGQGMYNIHVTTNEASKDKFVTKVFQENYEQALDQLTKTLK